MTGTPLNQQRHVISSPFVTTGPPDASLFSSMSSTPQSHSPHPSRKRARPDDLDMTLTAIPNVVPPDLNDINQRQMGAAYAEAAAQSDLAPMHHHHRLPDTEAPSQTLRRDDDGSGGGSAPSVVGQPGMPLPAARPRGPKLKFTAEDDQLLVELKENRNLTWKQIADFFPGRSSGTLQVRYCTKLKAKSTQWTDEADQKLRRALQDYENEKWRIVANKVGSGFTPAACRERDQELADEDPL